MTEAAPQRHHDLQEVRNARRGIVHIGAPWRKRPGTFPPRATMHQQVRRGIDAGLFTAIVHDLRALLRWRQDRPEHSSAVMLDA